jgi:hypothetical protein
MSNEPDRITEILSLPVATGATYQLDDLDIIRLRQRIYLINKDNAAGWRWRTTKIATKTKNKNSKVVKNLTHTLIVWRVK